MKMNPSQVSTAIGVRPSAARRGRRAGDPGHDPSVGADSRAGRSFSLGGNDRMRAAEAADCLTQRHLGRPTAGCRLPAKPSRTRPAVTTLFASARACPRALPHPPDGRLARLSGGRELQNARTRTTKLFSQRRHVQAKHDDGQSTVRRVARSLCDQSWRGVGGVLRMRARS